VRVCGRRIVVEVTKGERLDLIPELDAYVARQCPVATQLSFDSTLEVHRVPQTEAEQARADAGVEFEKAIFESIVTLHGEAVSIVESDGPRGSVQEATLSAMATGASVVLGGWLPDDRDAHRTGRPDVLLEIDGGWIPIDVKHHGITAPSDLRSERKSDLEDLWPDKAPAMPGVVFAGHALGDALQLAHYWRLLEACGLAADVPVGGIIASDGGVWWIDLTEPRWRHQSASALEIYDREFRLRVDVIARQIRRNDDPAVAPLVIPLRKTECSSCGWRQLCGEQLVDADSVSLIPKLSWPNALRLIQHDVATREDLAGLDWDTAWIMHGGAPGATEVDLVEILNATEQEDPPSRLTEILGTRKRTRLIRLAQLGIHTVGEVTRLDRKTAALSGVAVGYLPGLIDQSRAAVAGQVLLARGLDEITVPRADVEVDVDMESSESGVYLWGTWTNLGDLRGGESRYRPFVSWTALDGELEAEVFAQFWEWLLEVRDSTVRSGRTFAAYCYSSAENTQMRRIADQSRIGPNREEVETFIASPEWIDLHAVIKRQLVIGTGIGLKEVAPMAGFHWRDDDPGGDQSTVWYERAVAHPEQGVREENRARLLAYNEDDVRATAAIREWLSQTSFLSTGRWPA
jgi:predicted RecB family nuclease